MFAGQLGLPWSHRCFLKFFFAKERVSREVATTSHQAARRERKTSGYLEHQSHFHADNSCQTRQISININNIHIKNIIIITLILKSLHWLPVHYRHIFKILLLIYKALNGQEPSYIKDLLKYRNLGHVLRSSNKHLLDEPVTKLKTYGDRAYSITASKLWNKLPLVSLDIRLLLSVTVLLKTKLDNCLRILLIFIYYNLRLSSSTVN